MLNLEIFVNLFFCVFAKDLQLCSHDAVMIDLDIKQWCRYCLHAIRTFYLQE